MKTDTLFYRLFQRAPKLALELLRLKLCSLPLTFWVNTFNVFTQVKTVTGYLGNSEDPIRNSSTALAT